MTNNLVDLYAVMQSFGYIKSEDFNLEGVTMMAKTGICSIVVIATPTRMSFSLHAKKIKPRVQPFFKRLQAPKMKGVRTCFTDSPGGKIYFLATAENTAYTYDDGEILGSLIGRIDIETMKIDFTKKLAPQINLKG
jgi:hypothetical protein